MGVAVADTLWLERFDRPTGRWIFEPEILDRFTKPDMNLEEIDEGEARAISG